MSEEALESNDEIQEEPKADDQPTAEDIASKGGWQPEDKYDGPPGEWRSAEVFNERGVWIKKHKAQEKRINEIESQFNTRLDNSNKLHKAAMDVQRDDLIQKRDAAIDLADKESALKHQESIDNLNIPEEAPVANPAQNTLDEWNRGNAWIFQQGPKSAYAIAQVNQYLGAGQDVNSAIANMEADISREFPDINPNRENHPIPEGGSKPGGKRQSGKLSWGELTSDEIKYYNAMSDAWGSKADYLQAVQDTRNQS